MFNHFITDVILNLFSGFASLLAPTVVVPARTNLLRRRYLALHPPRAWMTFYLHPACLTQRSVFLLPSLSLRPAMIYLYELVPGYLCKTHIPNRNHDLSLHWRDKSVADWRYRWLEFLPFGSIYYFILSDGFRFHDGQPTFISVGPFRLVSSFLRHLRQSFQTSSVVLFLGICAIVSLTRSLEDLVYNDLHPTKICFLSLLVADLELLSE